MPFGWVAAATLATGVYSANKASKASNKASDTQAGIAADNLELGHRQQDFVEKQYADSQKLYQEYAPLLKNQIQLSIDEQAKSTQRGDQQWSNYLRDFAPAEQKLARTALEFDTPQRREQAAADAIGQTANAFDAARANTRRSLSDAGLKVDAGRMAVLDSQSRIEQAKASSLAGNEARKGVEMQGLSLVDNAARFGRNMPSTGLQTAALAGQQGQQAQGAYGTVANAQAAPTQAAIGGLSQVARTNAGAADIYLNAYKVKADGMDRSNAAISDGLGALGSLAGMYFSSEKKKRVGKKVKGAAASKAVEESPAKHWRYNEGEGDGSTKDRMGPTAESLAAVAPQVSDGERVDGIAMLGLHHAAIGDQSKRIARIEKRLGLADAKSHRKAA